MKFGNFIVLATIVAAVFGLAFLLVPTQLVALYGVKLTPATEVITFVNRHLEPYRGFHVFMRALPRLLRERPHAHVLIAGGDEPGYGQPPRAGRNWREVLLAGKPNAVKRN